MFDEGLKTHKTNQNRDFAKICKELKQIVTKELGQLRIEWKEQISEIRADMRTLNEKKVDDIAPLRQTEPETCGDRVACGDNPTVNKTYIRVPHDCVYRPMQHNDNNVNVNRPQQLLLPFEQPTNMNNVKLKKISSASSLNVDAYDDEITTEIGFVNKQRVGYIGNGAKYERESLYGVHKNLEIQPHISNDKQHTRSLTRNSSQLSFRKIAEQDYYSRATEIQARLYYDTDNLAEGKIQNDSFDHPPRETQNKHYPSGLTIQHERRYCNDCGVQNRREDNSSDHFRHQVYENESRIQGKQCQANPSYSNLQGIRCQNLPGDQDTRQRQHQNHTYPIGPICFPRKNQENELVVRSPRQSGSAVVPTTDNNNEHISCKNNSQGRMSLAINTASKPTSNLQTSSLSPRSQYFTCQGYGHVSRECPNNSKLTYSLLRSPSMGEPTESVCFDCQSPGCFEENSPKKIESSNEKGSLGTSFVPKNTSVETRTNSRDMGRPVKTTMSTRRKLLDSISTNRQIPDTSRTDSSLAVGEQSPKTNMVDEEAIAGTVTHVLRSPSKALNERVRPSDYNKCCSARKKPHIPRRAISAGRKRLQKYRYTDREKHRLSQNMFYVERRKPREPTSAVNIKSGLLSSSLVHIKRSPESSVTDDGKERNIIPFDRGKPLDESISERSMGPLDVSTKSCTIILLEIRHGKMKSNDVRRLLGIERNMKAVKVRTVHVHYFNRGRPPDTRAHKQQREHSKIMKARNHNINDISEPIENNEVRFSRFGRKNLRTRENCDDFVY